MYQAFNQASKFYKNKNIPNNYTLIGNRMYIKYNNYLDIMN